MAQAIICDVCNTNVAAFLVTNMADGQTFAGCGPDFVEWCRAMAAEVDKAAAETPPETPEAGAPESGGEAADGAPAEGQPKSDEEPPPETEQEPQPDEDTASVAAND